MAKKKAASKTDKGLQHEEEAISTGPMKPEIISFKIIGITPLLQNNPVNFIGKSETESMTTKKKSYDDAEEAALRIYKDDNGNFLHPAESFKKSMVKAVTGRRVAKQAAPGVIKGLVFNVEPYCIILDGKGKPKTKYTIDRRSVVIPTTKARILRCRPCWQLPWQMMLAIEIDTSFIDRQFIFEALSMAGRTVGIGDFRPEKNGSFGRFYCE